MNVGKQIKFHKDKQNFPTFISNEPIRNYSKISFMGTNQLSVTTDITSIKPK